MTTDIFQDLMIAPAPSISKFAVEDLGDTPELHRWRAWWAPGDLCNEVGGIALEAYPVIRLTPAGAWIDIDGCRQATKQPWEDGAPARQWVKDDWHRKRWVGNYSAQAWAKPTQEEAIRSLAIRLTRWTQRIARDAERAASAARALGHLRPDLQHCSATAFANLRIEARGK